MRLRDRDHHDEGLDQRAERELDAIERALAGTDVEPELTDWAELAEMLRDERPDPDQEWAAELDEAAEHRFSHRPGEGGGSSWTGIATRLGDIFPRRITPAFAALATLAVVGVVAATTLSGGEGDGSDSVDQASSTVLETTTAEPSIAEDSGGELAVPSAPEGDLATPPTDIGRSGSGSGSGSFGGGQGPISPGTENRKVDRDVSLALTAPPEDVNDVSDEAISITRDLDGIVASSNVSTAGNDASASLQLVIPTRNLDEAIDRLTEIGDVKSLNEGTVDITHFYVSAKDRLEDAEAERRKLLEALGNASTDAEAEALRLQIADARREIARAQAQFDRVSRRAQLSEMSLTIEGDRNASSKDDDEGRTFGDWLDDTVSVLRDVAGVLLVSAAILIPAAILLTIAWLVIRAILRRRRERALD